MIFNGMFKAFNQEDSGWALRLDSPDAATYLIENRIVGEVSLYGDRQDENYTADQLKELANGILKNLGEFCPSGEAMGTLHMHNNHLTVLSAGQRNLETILKEGTLGRVYRAAFLTDNWIEARQQWYTAIVSERLTLTANSYDASGGLIAGVMIACGSTFTGNQALNEKVMMADLSQFSKDDQNKAANVGITITNL